MNKRDARVLIFIGSIFVLVFIGFFYLPSQKPKEDSPQVSLPTANNTPAVTETKTTKKEKPAPAIDIKIRPDSCSSSKIYKTDPHSKDVTVDNILHDTNSWRVECGFRPLRLNPELTKAAKAKLSDMQTRGYFAHYNGENDGVNTFIDKTKYLRTYAGENLARGFATSEATVDAWMNSQLHKENLLSPNYIDIGIAVSADGIPELGFGNVVVQFFGTPER